MRPHDFAPADDSWAGALLLHPHPDMGGDRFNNVVSALFEALPAAGVSALRFDFSSSDLATAAAETVDMLDELDGPLRFLVAYSFGGGIAATIDDERIDGWYLVAPALTMVEPVIGADPRPKGIAAGEHDRFFSPARLGAATDDWANTDVTTITGTDHFFAGRTDELAKRTVEFLRQAAP